MVKKSRFGRISALAGRYGTVRDGATQFSPVSLLIKARALKRAVPLYLCFGGKGSCAARALPGVPRPPEIFILVIDWYYSLSVQGWFRHEIYFSETSEHEII